MSHPYDTGRTRARRRRRQRSAAIAGAVALVVFGGAAYAIAYVTGAVGSHPSAVPASCQVTTPPAPQSAVRLNVYNASGEKGQAGSVAEAMQSRDFDVAVVSNDPYKEHLDGVGQIRFGPAGKSFATKYVKPLIPGVTMTEDGRTDSSVDIVLGKQFPQIKKAKPSPQPTVPGC